MGVNQIETLTVLGTVTGSGNAKVTVTSKYIATSPVVVSVAVLITDTASIVAGKVRPALALTPVITAIYGISGTGADVVLTANEAKANDTTLNIAIDNDTCTGLTAVPTSTNTLAGSGITNGYASLQDFADWNRPQSSNAIDDSVVESLINSASRYIDSQSNTTFYPTSESLYFDVPLRPYEEILFPRNVLSVTTVTNGDGSVIASSNYLLWPANEAIKYKISLVKNAGVMWRDNSGNFQQVIKIDCQTGDSLTTPDDIHEACLVIVKAAYNRRFGENVTTNAVATPAGVIITPEDVPAKAMDIITNHRRVGFA